MYIHFKLIVSIWLLTFLLGGVPIVLAAEFEVNNIPQKSTGDAISAVEFNTIVDTLKGIKRNDYETVTLDDDLFGIGLALSSPSEKLEVGGNIKADKFIGDGSELTNLPDSHWIKTGSSINYQEGKVGIGIATPSARFQVEGGVIVDLPSTGSYSDFLVNLFDGSAALKVQPNGAVGVGTSTPTPGLLMDIEGALGVGQLCDESGAHCLEVSDIVTGGGIANLWTDNSGKIYYNSGNVGIGATDPEMCVGCTNKTLEIKGENPGIALNDQTGSTQKKFRIFSDDGFLRFASTESASNLSKYVQIDTEGNMSIGSPTAASKLEVNGGLKLGTDTSACSGIKEGTLRYSGGHVEVCNGTSWIALGSGGGGGSLSVGPGFYAHRTASQSISSGSWIRIDYTAEEFDKTNDFDLSNDRFEPSVAGRYILTAQTRYEGMSSQDIVFIQIKKNGQVIARDRVRVIESGYTNRYPVTKVSVVAEANGTSDYFEVETYHDFGENRNLNANKYYTNFTGSLVNAGA